MAGTAIDEMDNLSLAYLKQFRNVSTISERAFLLSLICGPTVWMTYLMFGFKLPAVVCIALVTGRLFSFLINSLHSASNASPAAFAMAAAAPPPWARREFAGFTMASVLWWTKFPKINASVTLNFFNSPNGYSTHLYARSYYNVYSFLRAYYFPIQQHNPHWNEY